MTTYTNPRPIYESLTQASERTGLSVSTLRRRIADGSLEAFRNGPRLIRVRPADVDRLMRPIPTG
ncbi:helix-turn-helix transcriptional regulator [Ornithinimicrobium panacihumi]|uniref:helix-turn-helix transcriptional regulator n=1 Tax=Ornithinimicrobium panacihumi TaxID=2008449 RepID=UPI003F8A4CDF